MELHTLSFKVYENRGRPGGKKIKKCKVGSILTFSSHAYVSQEAQNQKHLFQFAQVLHIAPCHQLVREFPLLGTEQVRHVRSLQKGQGK